MTRQWFYEKKYQTIKAGSMSSIFSSNSEAKASELLENLEDMFPRYEDRDMYVYMETYLYDRK